MSHTPAAVVAAPGSSSPLRSLGNRAFRMLWLGSLLTFTGFSMQMLARGWLMLELTNSAFLVSLTAAMGALPQVFLSVLGGLLADRYDRRTILIAGEVVNLVMYGLLAVLAFAGVVTPWQVMALSLVTGCAFALSMPARVAILPTLVPRQDLQNAIALNTTMFSTGQIIGPALAGGVIGWLGIPAGLAVCATLVAPAIFFFAIMGQPPFSGERPTGSALDNLKEGFAYIRGSRVVMGLILIGLAGTVFGLPYQVLLPVLARDHLGLGSEGLGLLQGVGGAGALAGSVLLALLGDSHWFRRFTMLSNYGLGLAVAAFALTPWFPLALLFSALTGILNQFYLTTNFTLVQMVVPDILRGRVMSIRMIIFGLMPLGSLAAGAAAEVIGAPQAVALGGLVCMLMVAMVLWRLPEVRKL